MRIVIFYFSGTGNTQWAADRMAESLKQNDVTAESISIESIRKSDVLGLIEKADMVGFGYPVYGSDIPDPMKDFMAALPKQQKEKPIIVFCTQMLFSGDGAFVYRKALQEKGYTITYSEHFNLTNNISIFGWLPIYPKNMHARCFVRAGKRIDAFARHIAQSKRHIHIRGGYILGIMQRAPFQKATKPGSPMRSRLGVDTQRCIGCERCARTCPVNNIVMQGKYPKWNGECVLCTRCYNFCPTAAITYNGKAHNTKKALYKGPDKTFKPEQLKKR